MNNLVLVSGIDVSNGGVGRLMKQLKPEAESRRYKIVTRRVRSISSLVRSKKYNKLFFELIYRITSLIIFKVKCQFIRNDIVLVLYPQTIGYTTFLRLIKRNTVFFYVMDNSFFCMMSYNYDVKNNIECMRCINNLEDVAEYCYSWPARKKKEAEIKYLQQLKASSRKIFFLAQAHHQKELIIRHFGPDTKCSVVGMDSGEVTIDTIEKLRISNNCVKNYDLVYHGSHHPAKGFLYILNLSKLLPNLKIFIPYSREEAIKALENYSDLDHVEFFNCTSETGLREAVENAKLVINPSIWSAPIEGALLKSLAFNGNVASINAEYGFQRELIDRGIIWELPIDTEKSAQKIMFILNNYFSKKIDAQTWLREFIDTNNVSNVFNVIDTVLSRQHL